MSYKVTEAFIENSRSKHGSRTVGLIIAEVAHHDGVGWLRIEPSKSKHRRRDDTDNIVFRTKLSAKQVRRCVDRLQDLDELEVVRAWDGRVRYYVYRLIVEPMRLREVDYQRGGLSVLEAPFWTPEQLQMPVVERPHDGHEYSPNQAAELGLTRGQNVPSSIRPETAPRADICDPDEETNAPPPYKEPVLGTVLTREAKASLVPADAGEGEDQLSRFEISLALSAALGMQVASLTRSERGAWESVAAQLAEVGATRDDITARCAAYRRVWPSARLTPMALVRHWTMLGLEVETGAATDPLEAWLEKAPQLFDRQTAHELLEDRRGVDPGRRDDAHRRLDELFDERQAA